VKGCLCQHDRLNSWTVSDDSNTSSKARTDSKMAAFRRTATRRLWFNTWRPFIALIGGTCSQCSSCCACAQLRCSCQCCFSFNLFCSSRGSWYCFQRVCLHVGVCVQDVSMNKSKSGSGDMHCDVDHQNYMVANFRLGRRNERDENDRRQWLFHGRY